ncbi:hypothetical protein PR001_g26408 [Phytophthora rubi]|uniref:Uncharacterized protein n=1 Tax=Phytophthora rubi TaxID=129364 RepID=A0A6A3HWK9_9STRA|nr:hypothetical protein PR001_g26408 [Phytophthora rubi]
MLTTLLWCETAWSKVTASTIQCWDHSGRLSSSTCNRASMTCMLTLKGRGTWSRTS